MAQSLPPAAVYLILAGAYFFSSLITIPFLLSFPGALVAKGGLIGGSQTAIWLWHFWHLLLPAIVMLSLVVHMRAPDRKLEARRVVPVTAAMLTGVALLVAALTLTATVLHDQLPVLIDFQRHPMTAAFYVTGGLAAALTLAALLISWRLGRKREILHLWLSVVLVAFLGDVIGSLGAHARYTLGWYFGRVEAMIAASVLVPVFIGEINLLYRHIEAVMGRLSAANRELLAAIKEKDGVMAELRQREEEVRQLAYQDTLTNLPNRRLLYYRLHQGLAQAKHFRRSLAVMFLDLDHFKEINDTLGHDVGDELLREVASRLSTCIRSGDTLCRVGGDEFIFILSEVHQPRDAALVAEKAIALLNEPFVCLGHKLSVTTSIGIAVYPIDGADDANELMKKADIAMYKSKEGGRNRYHFFSLEQG